MDSSAALAPAAPAPARRCFPDGIPDATSRISNMTCFPLDPTLTCREVIEEAVLQCLLSKLDVLYWTVLPTEGRIAAWDALYRPPNGDEPTLVKIRVHYDAPNDQFILETDRKSRPDFPYKKYGSGFPYLHLHQVLNLALAHPKHKPSSPAFQLVPPSGFLPFEYPEDLHSDEDFYEEHTTAAFRYGAPASPTHTPPPSITTDNDVPPPATNDDAVPPPATNDDVAPPATTTDDVAPPATYTYTFTADDVAPPTADQDDRCTCIPTYAEWDEYGELLSDSHRDCRCFPPCNLCPACKKQFLKNISTDVYFNDYDTPVYRG